MIKNISEFGGSDTEALSSAFEFLRENKGATLLLEPKIYRIDSPAVLENAGEITVEGNGATLCFAGECGGIAVRNCNNATFRNLFVEYNNLAAKYSVVASDPFGFSIRSERELNTNPDGFAKDGRIIHCDGKEERFLSVLKSENIISAAVSYDASIRVSGDFPGVKVGDYIYVTNPKRSDTALSIAKSCGVKLENFVILGSFGDAICAVDSANLDFNRTNAVSTPGMNVCCFGRGMAFDSCDGVKLSDCALEGIFGAGFVFENMKEKEILLSGVYTRNCYDSSVVAPVGNVRIEGGVFDACRETALDFYADGSRAGETVIIHNRITRRGEKYRYAVKKNAGAIVVNADSSASCSDVNILHNMIISLDTEGAIYANGVNGIKVYGNEILSVLSDKEVVFENCTDVTEEANRR